MGLKEPWKRGKRKNEKDSAYPGLPQNAEHESPGGSPKRKTRKQRKAQLQKDSYHRSKNEKPHSKNEKLSRPHSKNDGLPAKIEDFCAGFDLYSQIRVQVTESLFNKISLQIYSAAHLSLYLLLWKIKNPKLHIINTFHRFELPNFLKFLSILP